MGGVGGYPSLSSSHSVSLESEYEGGWGFAFDFRVGSDLAFGFGLGFERRSVFESSEESYLLSSRGENLQ